MKTKWYKKRNWYFIACIWDTSDTSAWYNDYAGSRRSAGQFNKIFQSSIGLNTQWGFFWCLKINDFQPKPRVCLWPCDWEGNQAWAEASADHVHLRTWIWNRKQDFKFKRKRRSSISAFLFDIYIPTLLGSLLYLLYFYVFLFSIIEQLFAI